MPMIRVLIARTLSQYANVYVEAQDTGAAEEKVSAILSDPDLSIGSPYAALMSDLRWEDGDVDQSEYVCDSEQENVPPGIDAAILR